MSTYILIRDISASLFPLFFCAVDPAKFTRERVVRMYTAQVYLLRLVCVGLCILCMRWQRWKIAQK